MHRFPRIFTPLSAPINAILLLLGLSFLAGGLIKGIPLLSTIGFVLYTRVVVSWWQQILNRLYRWKKTDAVTTLLGSWAMLTLLCGMLAVMLVWNTYSVVALLGSFVLTAAATGLFRQFTLQGGKGHIDKIQIKPHIHIARGTFFAPPRLLALAYMAGLVGVVAHMHSLQSGAALFSPWQTFDAMTLWVIFALSIMLGVMIFSRFKTKVILVFIILHSFLIHAAIPLSHTLPVGGDVYRMMGAQEQLIAGEYIEPVLFPNPQMVQLSWLKLPKVFVQPHKYVYAQLWAYEISAQEVFGVSMHTANRWLIVLLWALFLPLLLYRLGRLLFTSPRYGVWLAALSVVPFSLQALGGLSLAISIGFLAFVWSILLLLLALQGKQMRHWILFALQSVWLFFAHPVYIVVVLIALVGIIVLGSMKGALGALKRVWFAVLSLLAMGVIPVLEWLAGISSFGFSGGKALHAVKQAVGMSSGWFYASMIRSHDILPFNLLFNHTPDYAFAASPFTSVRWHVMVAAIMAILLALYGVYRLYIKEQERSWWLLALVGAAVAGGYGIGWFGMGGDHSFVRRLDPMVTLFAMLFILYGVARFFSTWKVRVSKRAAKGVFAILVLFLSGVTVSSLASGPDLRTMNETEYALAVHIAEKPVYSCILADTWPLLGLEATSGGRYIGGNFPIGSQHQQPEREALLEELYLAVSQNTKGMAELYIPEGEFCLVALQKQRVDTQQLPLISSVFMSSSTESGAYYLWEYDRRLPGGNDSGMIESETNTSI